mmetsp:Transcript_108436/g.280392  ORF Transcript_108436/g.280392 Transcript_108436/m.280392 type:complete len:285 (-) Transcript_108436:801-1655(-)
MGFPMVWQQTRLQSSTFASAETHDAQKRGDREQNGTARNIAPALPRCTQAQRPVVGDKLLLRAPLRHPLQLLLPECGRDLRGIHFGGMLLHLLVRSDVILTELTGSHCRCDACLVRKGALAREDVVEPLSKEPAVQRHHAAMRHRDLLQLPRQGALHMGRKVIVEGRLRAHVAHDRQDLAWLRCRRAHLVLDFLQEAFTIVGAANEVVLRGDDAIRRCLDIVRDDDLLAEPARLIQRAQIAEVGLGFPEAPLGIERRRIEPRQRHAASAMAVHRNQGGLHGDAL